MTAASLERDTRAVPLGERRYAIELPPNWNFLTPSGGVLMGAAMRAMSAELADPTQRILSATATFCEPIRDGRLTATVDVLRRGRTASQVHAVLANGEVARPAMSVLATFGADRPGPDVTGRPMPDVPGPSAARESPTRRYRMSFFDNFEDRLALGHLWNEDDWSAGEAEFARWLRYVDPPRLADGTLPEYALPGIADLMPPSLLQALGPGQGRFLAPSLDLTLHFFERPTSDWILSYGRCLRANGGVASCSVELWDEAGRLLAFATQVMMLRRWPKEE